MFSSPRRISGYLEMFSSPRRTARAGLLTFAANEAASENTGFLHNALRRSTHSCTKPEHV